jgi:2-polyprenyl-3-methyl-5-hydroxy-6-metoxy-1,4-benzoquinol methylase
MSVITIGIPRYRQFPPETEEDYMRLMYYLGRRLPQHEFVLAIKSKTEQFRARNSITEAAIQVGSDYLLFLDDDHVIGWETIPEVNGRYGFVDTLVKHMENDPKLGIVGGLYYHRGAQCRPVLMKIGTDGGYYWMRDDEIKHGLQEVGVQGGGCMLLRLSMFNKIRSPWFEPEFELGTDIQICKKAQEAGYKVACDTSIVIGHVLSSSEVITPQNRNRVIVENAQVTAGVDEGLEKSWLLQSALTLYRMDAEAYMNMPMHEMGKIAERYDMADLQAHRDDLTTYYGSRGMEQLARQVLFHHTPSMIRQMDIFLGMINTQAPGYGIDVGCGSAPTSFELAMRGHRIDFIDVEGSGAYNFTKWRAKRRGIEDRCGFTWAGPYDYAMMFDSLEHIEDWRGVLLRIIGSLKENGVFITNYLLNMDFQNPEHISMDKEAVQKFLVQQGVYPLNELMWVKNPALGRMDKKEVADESHSEKDCVLR